MSRYESGYDPKYGYNKNAFAHGTVGTKVMSMVVKGIALPIGLVSEAIHDHKDKKRSNSGSKSSSPDAHLRRQGDTEISEGDAPAPYFSVTEDQGRELIASGQAVPADGHAPTHELVPEEDSDGDAAVGDADRDEADWELDEISRGPEDDHEDFTNVTVEYLIREVQAARAPARNIVSGSQRPGIQTKLPFPVVVPQRRPGTKTRGFVRAYAPVLEDVDIDQAMFLSFIQNLHKAAQSSTALQVVQVGLAMASVYPDPTIGLAIQAAQVAVSIAQEIQERWKTNKFLEQVNKEIFIPRGLYAMIVTYKPSTDNGPRVSTKTIDFAAQALAKYGGPVLQDTEGPVNGVEQASGSKRLKEKMKRLRVGDGTTNGEAEMPFECAPLIFPAIEEVAMKTTRDGKNETLANWQSKSKEAGVWMGDYFDRRAQAKFAFQNPDAKLANMNSGPVQFKSKFADPNHAVNTHLFTLLTGGKFKAEPLGARRRWEKAKRREVANRSRGLKAAASKRFLSEDVLYLQIVNMPTEEQLASARKELSEKQGGR